MIISKTPYRVSFFGGGTDYPEYYLDQGGVVLATTIDKYCYLSCRLLPAFFNVKHRVVWSHIETVSSISEILHPAVREGMRFMGFDDSFGLEIHHQGDLPARAGMGSSSAFAVGLINALARLQGKELDHHELALRAIDLEQNVLRERVGSQDQVSSAYGGLNQIHFETTGQIRVCPVHISEQRIAMLERHLMLFYTGTTRLASEVAGTVIANFARRRRELQALKSLVEEAVATLTGMEELDNFGKLLNESWLIKRELSDKISNPTIDEVYDRALACGALGGKLLGAGSSGFILLYVPEEKQPAVLSALSGLLYVPVRFENNGSTILYDSEENRIPTDRTEHTERTAKGP